MFEDYLDMSLLFLCIAIVVSILVYLILRNPFKYPYFIYKFNVTSKRNVEIKDYIDNFLCDEENWLLLQCHQQEIEQWKIGTENYIKNCRLKNYRYKQYLNILDDDHAYRFKTVREQTRYRQKNYIKTSYKVLVDDYRCLVNWEWLVDRYEQLEKIGFETTLNKYHSQSQRRLMTPSLRKQIMIRDNYTCQICGRYMGDEVGLHIDHVIPIAKGGKSVPSNLRVLCSKCNGSKGAR